MPPKPEIEAAPAESIKDQLIAAFAERDAAAQAFSPDPAALDAAERKVQELVHRFNEHEDFNPAEQPVLYSLSMMARSRNPLAVRLLLQERIEHELYQAPANEPQWPAEEIGINGVICTIPRGISLLLPKSYSEILKQGKVR